MNIGQRVKINMPDTIWHDKEGVVEDINDSVCTVFVDFIPEEGKKIRQDFNLDAISEDLTEAHKKKKHQQDLTTSDNIKTDWVIDLSDNYLKEFEKIEKYNTAEDVSWVKDVYRDLVLLKENYYKHPNVKFEKDSVYELKKVGKEFRGYFIVEDKKFKFTHCIDKKWQKLKDTDFQKAKKSK